MTERLLTQNNALVSDPNPNRHAGTNTGVTWRGWVVGLGGVVAVSTIVSWAEAVLITIQVGYLQMPPAVIGTLLLLVLLNNGLRRLAPRASLTTGDLAVAYAMMLVSAMIASRGWMQKLLPLLVAPGYFDGGKAFLPHLPRWAIPFDPSGDTGEQMVVTRFFERLRPGESVPWGAWVVPLLAWSLLALCVFGAFLCLASLLRRQWTESERLSYPLVQLPLALIGDDSPGADPPPLRSPLLWTGFVVAFGVYLWKGAHMLSPSLPDVSLDIDLDPFLQTPPWNGAMLVYVKLSFAVIGFLYLLPTDLLFSLWFFVLMARLQDVGARAANVDAQWMPLYPCPAFRGYQAAGAYLIVAAHVFWNARAHLAAVWRVATASKQNGDDSDDANEMLPRRTAFWGFWGCALGAGVFLVALGMNPWLAALQLGGLFLLVAIVMARSTAEAGMLMTEASFRPVDFLRLATPLHSLGPESLAALAMTDALLLRDQRGLVLTGILDGLRLADGTHTPRRKFWAVFAVATVVAVAVSSYIQLRLPYERGGLTLYSYIYNGNNRWSWDDYRPALADSAPSPIPLWQGAVFLPVGIAVTALLFVLRNRFAGFPLHPLGYVLCSSWTLVLFWSCALIAWVIKSNILRYGGLKAYRASRPFFFGLILGEFVAALFWTLMNAVFDIPTPAFPWS